MAINTLQSDADWRWTRSARNPFVDQDIVSFCTPSPHLVELAFTLADHGHTHVGDVVRLGFYTLIDLSGGDPRLAEQLRLRLQRAGLDLDMRLEGWRRPLEPCDSFAE